jgi:hypothetical protein
MGRAPAHTHTHTHTHTHGTAFVPTTAAFCKPSMTTKPNDRSLPLFSANALTVAVMLRVPSCVTLPALLMPRPLGVERSAVSASCNARTTRVWVSEAPYRLRSWSSCR